MFDWNDQQQAGDTIWVEFDESEDHIVPYPKGTEDSALVNVADGKKNKEEAISILGPTERSSGGQTGFPGLEKQSAIHTSGQYSATRLDMEPWPDLPSLNAALGENYSNDNDEDTISAAYLDFNTGPNLEKVRGNTTVQLDGEPEGFGNDLEENSNSFLVCDWGNIGDFDDFDRLFSNSDSIFGNEMVASGGDFLSSSSDVVDSTVRSIPIPHVPLNKQQSHDHGPSLLQINDHSGGITKQENKVADINAKSGEQAEHKNHLTCEYSGKPNLFSEEGDVHKKTARSRRKPEERGKNKVSNNMSICFSQNQGQHPRPSLHALAKAPVQSMQTPAQYALFHDGKNMGHVQHANYFMFSGYGYPAYPFPTIPLMSNIQAEGHQTKPAATSYGSLTDSPKHSSSAEKPQDVPSRPLMMTPQEKIEKLRRRQQMQAMLAIQQQQQQFGQEVLGSDPLVTQAYSPRNKNQDSLGGSIVVDDAANKVFSPELIPTIQEEVQKSSIIPDDPFIEEKIYYQLQDALRKLDTRTRLCIRDSLLRLAQSATERQIASDRSSTNKSNKDEDEVSENDTSTRNIRSPKAEAETKTNPIDRMVAHFLFHRHGPKVVTPAKEEIMSSTPLSFGPDSKVPSDAPTGPSSDQQNAQGMELQPSL